MCISIGLSKHVNNDERLNPIGFGGQRSKIKVIMDLYDINFVNTKETEPLCMCIFIKLGKHVNYEGQSKISESCFISDKLLLVWAVFV